MTTSPVDRHDVAVTVVASPSCHFCADADAALAEFAEMFPLVVTKVDIRSEPGQRLVQDHGAALTPLVLLDGRFFSHGRLPRRKLAHLLTQRLGTAPGPDGA